MTVQGAAPAAISTPVTVMVLVPAVAVRTSAAPALLVQVPARPFGVEIITPTGRVSVKPISLVSVALLVMVNVSAEG